MVTGETRGEVRSSIAAKVTKFYDVGSAYYLKVFGKHIHDGYYITGNESREEAQENLIRLLADKIKIAEGAAVLDVGCGMGGSSIWLTRNRGARTTGITISPAQIEIARRLAREQQADANFLLMNAEEMSFPEPFDIVWLVAALTHFADQKGFFTLAARHLKKKGKLVFFDWTVNEEIGDTGADPDLQAIIAGMVLAGLHSNNEYLNWMLAAGYRIIYAEDITAFTVKTWSVALALLKKASTWQYIYTVAREEGPAVFDFINGLRKMKKAMLAGKVRASAVVAEKI